MLEWPRPHAESTSNPRRLHARPANQGRRVRGTVQADHGSRRHHGGRARRQRRYAGRRCRNGRGHRRLRLSRDYAERDAPLFSYSVAASEVLPRPDTRILVLVESDGVATLDVDTGCLRVAGSRPCSQETRRSPHSIGRGGCSVDHQDLVSVNLDTFAVTRGGRVADAAHYTEVEFNSISNDIVFWGESSTALSVAFDANTLIERPVELLTDGP